MFKRHHKRHSARNNMSPKLQASQQQNEATSLTFSCVPSCVRAKRVLVLSWLLQNIVQGPNFRQCQSEFVC